MRSEVRAMKSKTSFFEPALLWNFIRRFWPLWLVYLVLTLVNLPVALVGNTEHAYLNWSVCSAFSACLPPGRPSASCTSRAAAA